MLWPGDLPSLYVLELCMARLNEQQQIMKWIATTKPARKVENVILSALFIECGLCCGAAAFSPGADSWPGSFLPCHLSLLSVVTDWQQGLFSLASSCFQAGIISCRRACVISTLSSVRLSVCLSVGWTGGWMARPYLWAPGVPWSLRCNRPPSHWPRVVPDTTSLSRVERSRCGPVSRLPRVLDVTMITGTSSPPARPHTV